MIGGGVVHRPVGPSTATVHAYLRHLCGHGLACVPEPLGIDGEGETLGVVKGEAGGLGWRHQHDDRGLASAARLLRRVHDAGADWVPPADAVWAAAPVPGDDLVLNPGDTGPWNFVWHEHEAVGLIDWDYLHLGPRRDDVAYALRWFAPLRSDETALQWHHFPTVPDRRERVRGFIDAYGPPPQFDVADAVVESIRTVIARMAELAQQGVEPQRTWVADGAIEGEEDEIGWIQQHRDLLHT